MVVVYCRLSEKEGLDALEVLAVVEIIVDNLEVGEGVAHVLLVELVSLLEIYGGILEWSELRRCIRRVSDQLDELPVCSHDRWNHEHSVPFIQCAVYF